MLICTIRSHAGNGGFLNVVGDGPVCPHQKVNLSNVCELVPQNWQISNLHCVTRILTAVPNTLLYALHANRTGTYWHGDILPLSEGSNDSDILLERWDHQIYRIKLAHVSNRYLTAVGIGSKSHIFWQADNSLKNQMWEIREVSHL